MLRPRNGESHASVILPTLGRNMLRPYKWFCVSPKLKNKRERQKMVDMGRALLLVAQEMKLGFVLHGKALTLDEVFAEKGLLPSLMRRSDQLSSFCLGYGLGLTFEETASARLGVVVKYNEEVPNAMRLMCATEILFELAESASDRNKIALDDLMYD